MRVHNSSRDTVDRMDSAFASADFRTSAPRSAATRLLNSSSRAAHHGRFVPSIQTPPTSRSEMGEFLAGIDGLPVLFRFLLDDTPAEILSDAVWKDPGLRSLLLSRLEKMVDRLRGSPLRTDEVSNQPYAIVEMIPSEQPLVRLPAPPNEAMLRVGPLELDLFDRTAKRGGRQLDLRPREFKLLKYMMERTDEVLTRATLLKDVWHYKFLPETNLVDVHMGRLRRKVDGANEAPMIRCVRGAGFVLGAAPLSQGSPVGSTA